MKKKNKFKKDFDCVEMKRKIQEQMYEETKGMTSEEYRLYIRQRIANSQFAWFLERSEESPFRSKISR